MSRWHSYNEDLSVDEEGPKRPSPGLGRKEQPRFDKESTAPWGKLPGPGGPDMNKGAKFPKVKAYVKKEGFC